MPAWNTFMAGQIDPAEQEETWGVFNSVQGFGSMIGPLFGGLIAQFSNGLNNTFYFSRNLCISDILRCLFCKVSRQSKSFLIKVDKTLKI